MGFYKNSSADRFISVPHIESRVSKCTTGKEPDVQRKKKKQMSESVRHETAQEWKASSFSLTRRIAGEREEAGEPTRGITCCSRRISLTNWNLMKYFLPNFEAQEGFVPNKGIVPGLTGILFFGCSSHNLSTEQNNSIEKIAREDFLVTDISSGIPVNVVTSGCSPSRLK